MAVHFVDKHVGQQIYKRRKLLRISQQALGKDIGVTLQQVQKYERGVNRASSSRLYLLAHALSVQVSYFFEGLSVYDRVTPPTLSCKTAKDIAKQLRQIAQRIEDELAA